MENQAKKPRTLAQLAREALLVQDACNLSGVVHGFSRAIGELRPLLEASGQGGTHSINRHPICQLWADKISSLAGTQFESSWATPAYAEVERLAAPEVARLDEEAQKGREVA